MIFVIFRGSYLKHFCRKWSFSEKDRILPEISSNRLLINIHVYAFLFVICIQRSHWKYWASKNCSIRNMNLNRYQFYFEHNTTIKWSLILRSSWLKILIRIPERNFLRNLKQKTVVSSFKMIVLSIKVSWLSPISIHFWK